MWSDHILHWRGHGSEGADSYHAGIADRDHCNADRGVPSVLSLLTIFLQKNKLQDQNPGVI